MFAIGRHPNVANLGLEKAGVAINPTNGGIAVDGWSKTSVDTSTPSATSPTASI